VSMVARSLQENPKHIIIFSSRYFKNTLHIFICFSGLCSLKTRGRSPGFVPAGLGDGLSCFGLVAPVTQHHAVAADLELPRRPQWNHLTRVIVHDFSLWSGQLYIHLFITAAACKSMILDN